MKKYASLIKFILTTLAARLCRRSSFGLIIQA